MAESDVQTDQISQEEEPVRGQQMSRLKYLDFVHVAAIQALLSLSMLYEFSKENSGLLKPGVQTVEDTVKAVVGPVYNKFHGVPSELLRFLDGKVGTMIGEIERHVPSLVKEMSSQVCNVTQKVSEVARSISGEFQRAGLVGTATGLARLVYTTSKSTAEKLYENYEPVAEQYAVSAWRSLNRLPVVPQVVQILVPTAAYWSDKYNKAVIYSADKGYAVAAYLPLVPTERIAKVFGFGGKAGESSSE